MYLQLNNRQESVFLFLSFIVQHLARVFLREPTKDGRHLFRRQGYRQLSIPKALSSYGLLTAELLKAMRSDLFVNVRCELFRRRTKSAYLQRLIRNLVTEAFRISLLTNCSLPSPTTSLLMPLRYVLPNTVSTSRLSTMKSISKLLSNKSMGITGPYKQ